MPVVAAMELPHPPEFTPFIGQAFRLRGCVLEPAAVEVEADGAEVEAVADGGEEHICADVVDVTDMDVAEEEGISVETIQQVGTMVATELVILIMHGERMLSALSNLDHPESHAF